jgi:hypothetical protein
MTINDALQVVRLADTLMSAARELLQRLSELSQKSKFQLEAAAALVIE